ncbi:MAG: GNAT family N-acetyltransferase [Oscillospiraceae bacterium]|nr:GNAT family N-acetyltransferase [Oscillospiraceae bacterium]
MPDIKNIKVRTAVIGDIDRIIDLLKQIRKLHCDGRPDMFRYDLIKFDRDYLNEIMKSPEKPLFVAVDTSYGDGAVVGYAICEIINYENHKVYNNFKSFYIDDICVDEKYRHSGIGTLLFEHCRKNATEQDCYCMDLNVWEFNQSAMKFYEKCGMSTRSRKMELIL